MIYINNEFLDLDDKGYYYIQVNMRGIIARGDETNSEIKRLSNELAMIIPASFKLYVQLGYLPKRVDGEMKSIINFNLN